MQKYAIALSVLFLWACGGGGGGSSPTEPQEPAPSSNFTATPTSGFQPLDVVFTSTSSGVITSYAWNVDADTSIESTASTHTHTYTDVGTYSVTLTVTGPGGSNTKTVTDMITVNSAAPTPTTNTSQTVQEDGTTTISLTATDPNGQAITFAISTDPTNGTATLSGADITYTPNANFYGSDSFAYTASNGTYTSEPTTITITVSGEDDGDPTTNDVSATTDEDTAVTVDLDATEIDGENYSFTIISQPSNGTLGSISGNQVDYTPNQDWNGTDTFTFEATDDRTARTNVATATITIAAVNDAPIANDVSGSTNENRMIQLDVTLDATDVDGDDLTYSIVGTNNGSITISGSTATYTPNQDWNGTDTFTYKANDGTVDSNTATATITVGAVNDAPIATDVNISTAEDTAASTTLAATDIDGDVLTYIIVSNPSNGSLGSVNGADVTYTPTANWNGTDTFTFKSNDGTVDSNIATVTVTVATVNDAPVANDVTASMDENKIAGRYQPVTITLDATDVEGDALTYFKQSDPTNGTLGSITNNQVVYTPTQDFNGEDTFIYKATDGSADSNGATVTITINSVNDAPVTTNQSAATNEDTAVDITLTSTDVDGDTIIYSIVSDVSNGTTSLSGATVTYTPTANWNGSDTFTFKANDGTVDSNTATLTITVAAVNDAPATTNVSTTTAYETATNITLSGTDIDGDTLTYSIVSDVSNGSTSLSGSTVSYTPNSTWSGTDTFTYKANDGTADSNTATVTITVNTDDAPAAAFTADETSGYAPQRVVFTNASSNSESYTWDFGDGNTSTDQNPKHTYTSAGTFTVTLTATGSGGSDSKTATITVSAVPNSSLTIDPKYIINKSTSSIEIKVKQVTNLTSAQLVLNIPTGMTVNSVASGAFLKGNTNPLMITTDNTSSNGTYSISITSLSSDLQSASGDGTLATITFTNSSTASSNVTFDTSNTKFLDNNGNTITINQTIGVFLVTE